MNMSMNKIQPPQARMFERGNKQLLLALASVSMLGFTGSAIAGSLAITPPSSVLTTDTQAIFKVSITGGSTFNEATIGCDTYDAGGIQVTAASGRIVAGGVTYSGNSVYTVIPAGTSVTANFPITLTLSGHLQGDVIGCNVVASSAATTVLDSYSTNTASLTVGVGGAGAAAQRLRVFDTTTQVTYTTTAQVYPAVPPQTSPTCVNIGLVAPNATNNPIKTLTVGSTIVPASADYVASLVFFPSPDTAFGLSSTTGSSVTSSLNSLNGLVLPPAATTYTGTAVGSFKLTFDPTKLSPAPSTYPYVVPQRKLQIFSSDPASNPAEIPISAVVVPDLNPKLQVNVDTSLAVAKDATIDLGTGIVGNTLSKTFTLKNVGYSNLVFSASNPTYAGTGTVTAGVYAEADKTLGPRALNTTTDGSCATSLSPSGDSTTFDLSMSNNIAGSYTGTVTVASNDAIYPSYTFKVKGTFQDAPPPPPLSPEIGVSFGSTEIQTDATTAIDFGATDIGTPVTKDITIKNVGIGAEDLLVTSVNFLGQNGQPSSNFKTVGTVANRVSQLSETTITVQFSPTASGTFNETVEIFNTDRANSGTHDTGMAENPFRIQLKGVANTTTSTGPALSIAPVPTNGTVTSDTGGISCGGTSSTCTANYTTGAAVKLTATPASGGTFTSWSGNCSGTTNPLSLTMDAAKTCSANFSGGTTQPTTQTLTVTKTGNGKIISQPTGIDCGTTCTSSLNAGSSVILTATPDTGSTFTSWSGDCSGTSANATLTMDAAKNCTATFSTSTTTGTTFALTLTAPTNGVISSQPTGINCGTGNSSCSGSFTANNIVALTATPDTGATFTSWGGDCSGSTNQLIVTMDKAKNCTATFTPAAATTQTLTVTKTGNGSISSNPVGISCGVDCSKTFTQGSSVVLTATPDTGATFTGWTGSCSGSTASVTVTMDAAKSCAATFTSTATGTCSSSNLGSCATTTTCATQGGAFIDSISGTGLTTQCNSVPKLTIPNTSTSSVGITTSGSRPTSTAQISGGTSVNGSVFGTPSAASGTQNVTWAGNVKVAPTDVGKPANILMVIGIEPPAQIDLTGYDGGTDTVYFGVDQTKQLYKVNLYADLVKDDAGTAGNIPGYFPDEVALMTSRSLLSNVTLTDSLAVSLWSGTLSTLLNNAVVKSSLTLGAQAKFYVFIGYALANDPLGSIVYNPVPVETTLVQ